MEDCPCPSCNDSAIIGQVPLHRMKLWSNVEDSDDDVFVENTPDDKGGDDDQGAVRVRQMEELPRSERRVTRLSLLEDRKELYREVLGGGVMEEEYLRSIFYSDATDEMENANAMEDAVPNDFGCEDERHEYSNGCDCVEDEFKDENNLDTSIEFLYEGPGEIVYHDDGVLEKTIDNKDVIDDPTPSKHLEDAFDYEEVKHKDDPTPLVSLERTCDNEEVNEEFEDDSDEEIMEIPVDPSCITRTIRNESSSEDEVVEIEDDHGCLTKTIYNEDLLNPDNYEEESDDSSIQVLGDPNTSQRLDSEEISIEMEDEDERYPGDPDSPDTDEYENDAYVTGGDPKTMEELLDRVDTMCANWDAYTLKEVRRMKLLWMELSSQDSDVTDTEYEIYQRLYYLVQKISNETEGYLALVWDNPDEPDAFEVDDEVVEETEAKEERMLVEDNVENDDKEDLTLEEDKTNDVLKEEGAVEKVTVDMSKEENKGEESSEVCECEAIEDDEDAIDMAIDEEEMRDLVEERK